MSVEETQANQSAVDAFWKRWEGQTLDGSFLLGEYLSGGPEHAVFATEYQVGKPQRAVVKVVLAEGALAQELTARWASAAKLSHPRLLRILSHGSCLCGNADCAYVVMEYADVSLGQVVADRPLTPDETDEFLGPLLEALVYVHSQGFTHGRVRPANILSVDDQLRISSDSLSSDGQSPWSPREPDAFQAPEAAAGVVSPPADVWAVGMVVVEALTQQQRPGNPLPPRFREMVDLCLRTDPDERPTSAQLAQRWRRIGPSPARQTKMSDYFVWILLFVLTVAALIVGDRFFRGHGTAPSIPATTTPVANAPATPSSKPSATPLETGVAPVPVSPEASASPPPASPAPVSARPAEAPVPALEATGDVLERVLPEVPRKARNTIHGTVKIDVRVRVDRDGRVEAAQFESPATSRYLGDLTLKAARRWRFQPGAGPGWLLRFQLLRDETKVTAERL